MMKKIALVVVMLGMSLVSMAKPYIVNIDTENMPVMDLESQENTEYWVTIFNTIQEAQTKKDVDKVIIKYDGKWKYVLSNVDSIIQMDVIMSHFTSGSSVKNGTFEKGMKTAFEIAKKDKIIVTIR